VPSGGESGGEALALPFESREDLQLDRTNLDVRKAVDLKSFRQKIAGDDRAAGNFFDYSIGSSFVEPACHKAKQR
jgi:hypothetical protein